MKEEIIIFSNSKAIHVGYRDVEFKERDPNKIWLGENSPWDIDPINHTVTHNDEQIGIVAPVDPSTFLLAKLVDLGEKTPEGHLINSTTAAWSEIGKQLHANPGFRFEFCVYPTQFEHFIAGGRFLEGWDAVTVTPQSGDKGRDVIAETNSKRILEQAKAYSAHRSVGHTDVRAMWGVLHRDERANQAVITTTTDFAPGIAEEFKDVIPVKLELKDGSQFLKWIEGIVTVQSNGL